MYFVPGIQLENPIYFCWWVLRPITISLSCHTSCLASFYWENIQKWPNIHNQIKIQLMLPIMFYFGIHMFYKNVDYFSCKTLLSFSGILMITNLCFPLVNQSIALVDYSVPSNFFFLCSGPFNHKKTWSIRKLKYTYQHNWKKTWEAWG